MKVDTEDFGRRFAQNLFHVLKRTRMAYYIIFGMAVVPIARFVADAISRH